jgi:surface protein
MFYNATNFNQDLGAWDVSRVTTMFSMFRNTTAFNQDISAWDVRSVLNMSYAFYLAVAFNQNIGTWDMSSVTNMTAIFYNTGISVSNFDAAIIGWYKNTVAFPSNVTFSGNVGYCESEETLALFKATYNWNIPTAKGGISTGFYSDCATAGFADENQLVVSIYPNPASNTLYILGNETPKTFSIYDVLGKEVIYAKNTDIINLETLPSGVYTIRISNGRRQANRKFVKN